ncbi:Vacuolar protein sorting-associated protein 33 [Yarrowia sp. B02]|nr:Vacuolar protein sorting-associated protein 33 [Yarrowia sp. B02]
MSSLSTLLDILDSVRGKKHLVIDRNLATQISLLCPFSVLTEHGVDKVFWLDESLPGADECVLSQAKIVYVVFSRDPESVKLLTQHQKVISNNVESHVIAVPKSLSLEALQLDVYYHSWDAPYVSLDADLYTLGLGVTESAPLLTKHTNRSSPDYVSVELSARALHALQLQFGFAGKLLARSDNPLSQKLIDELQRLKDDYDVENAQSASRESSFLLTNDGLLMGEKVEQLIILDRQDDPLTPLLSQLTYAGLIDEFWGLSANGKVEIEELIPSHVTASSSSSAPSSQMFLNDTLYKDIKDTNFSSVGAKLNNLATNLQSDYGERHKAKTVSEIKSFVGKLSGLTDLHTNLKLHTHLSELIMKKLQKPEFNRVLEIQQNLVADSLDLTKLHEMLQDLIGGEADINTVLRLLSIESLVNGGIKEKVLSQIKKEICQTYGHEHFLTFQNLQKMGLVVPKQSSSYFGYSKTQEFALSNFSNSFGSLSKQLHVISDQQDVDDTSIASAYSGYAPISVRTVEALLSKKTDMFTKLVDYSYTDVSGAKEENEKKVKNFLSRDFQKKKTVVFFLGGVTWAEISALRLLGKSVKTELVIVTTGIINGNDVVKAAY